MQKKIALSIVLTIMLYTNAFSSGACCAITKTDDGIAYISVIGSHSWGHQMIAGEHYSKSQQSILIKFGIPVYKGLSLRIDAGAPIRTAFGMENRVGFGGLIIGGGAGYSFPQIAKRLSLAISGGADYTSSFINSENRKEHLTLTQLLGSFAADLKIITNLNVYAGVSVSFDKEKIINDTEIISDEPMFMISPSVGVRWKINNTVSALFEGGFGHYNVLSAGIIFPLKIKKENKLALENYK